MDRMPHRAVPPAKRAAGPSVPAVPAQTDPQKVETLWQAKKPWIIVAVVLLILAGALMGWRLYASSTSSLIKKDRYQAVFLTNGQVYFGKLSKVNDQNYRLTDIYYLESNNTQAGAAANTQNTGTTPKLLKFGKEIHGPENEMIISEKQVLFFENITPEGNVGKAIESDKQNKE